MPSPNIYTIRTIDGDDVFHVGGYSNVSNNAFALRMADNLLPDVSDVFINNWLISLIGQTLP